MEAFGHNSKSNVPPEEIERLHQIGNWLAVNGKAIYGTNASLFGPEAGSFSATQKDEEGKPKFVPKWNWRSTTAANEFTLNSLGLPQPFHLDRVPRNVTGAFLLADASKKSLKVARSGSGVDIELPSPATDSIATVLVAGNYVAAPDISLNLSALKSQLSTAQRAIATRQLFSI